jgi:hypothetical protein
MRTTTEVSAHSARQSQILAVDQVAVPRLARSTTAPVQPSGSSSATPFSRRARLQHLGAGVDQHDGGEVDAGTLGDALHLLDEVGRKRGEPRPEGRREAVDFGFSEAQPAEDCPHRDRPRLRCAAVPVSP